MHFFLLVIVGCMAFLVTDFTLRIIWTALRNWWDNLAEGTQTFLSSISGCIQGRIAGAGTPPTPEGMLSC